MKTIIILLALYAPGASFGSEKDDIDQGAHFGIGLIATYALAAVFPPVLAATTVLTGAFTRELSQHNWSVTEMGAGSWRDMGYWTLGTAIGVSL